LRLRFEPEKVKMVRTPGFQSRQVTLEEWQTFEELHMASCTRYNGPVCRSKDYWTRRFFEVMGQPHQAWLVEKGGEPRGFLVGRINDSPTGMDPELYRVLQAVWLDGEAQRAVFNILGSLRNQIKQVLLFLPPDADWSHCFDEFKFESKLEPKMMTKVVDLKPALEGLPYEPDVSGGLVIQMTPDPGAPWNEGVWQLTWSAGKVTVTHSQTVDPHAVRLTPHVLAQLYIGYRTVAEMIEAGQLVAAKDQADLLGRAFPKYPAYLDDWF